MLPIALPRVRQSHLALRLFFYLQPAFAKKGLPRTSYPIIRCTAERAVQYAYTLPRNTYFQSLVFEKQLQPSFLLRTLRLQTANFAPFAGSLKLLRVFRRYANGSQLPAAAPSGGPPCGHGAIFRMCAKPYRPSQGPAVRISQFPNQALPISSKYRPNVVLM